MHSAFCSMHVWFFFYGGVKLPECESDIPIYCRHLRMRPTFPPHGVGTDSVSLSTCWWIASSRHACLMGRTAWVFLNMSRRQLFTLHSRLDGSPVADWVRDACTSYYSGLPRTLCELSVTWHARHCIASNCSTWLVPSRRMIVQLCIEGSK